VTDPCTDLGTGVCIHPWLRQLEHGLADAVLLVVYPVLLGTGKRLLAGGTPARSFELTSTEAMSSGVILSTYTPAGPLRAA
jgi:dihydrofolate reductase